MCQSTTLLNSNYYLYNIINLTSVSDHEFNESHLKIKPLFCIPLIKHQTISCMLYFEFIIVSQFHEIEWHIFELIYLL